MPISLSPQAARLLSAPVRTRKRLIMLCGLILAAAVVAFLVHRQRYISENDARVMADMITISSRVDGWVAQRNVTDGDVVTEGSQLVVIDQREALMQVQELKASDEALRLESEQVKTRLETSRGATESAVAAAQASSHGEQFKRAKRETAEFYYARVLPRTRAHKAAIEAAGARVF